MSKKKVLIFVDWYLPGYKAGGPIKSVANIVQQLKNDFDFSIVTSACDLHETSPYPNIVSDQWTKAPDGTRVWYSSASHITAAVLKKIMLEERADVIYMNSLFSYHFTLLPLYIRKTILPSRKVVLAPRGMLGSGALNIKPLKKKIFLYASRLMGLYRHITWHASTDMEANEIKKYFGSGSNIITASNLSTPQPLQFISRRKEKNTARFVFISRIASKKNLLPVIEMMQQLPQYFQVEFDIYGPIDDAGYWKQCELLIASGPSHIRIRYMGSVENNKVNEILSRYHYNVLYTQHENFGHSIIEGLSAACPAIISDQTPWRALPAAHAGWDIAINDNKALLKVLTLCCEMEQQEYDKWSLGALTFAERVIHNKEAVAANKSLFL